MELKQISFLLFLFLLLNQYCITAQNEKATSIKPIDIENSPQYYSIDRKNFRTKQERDHHEEKLKNTLLEELEKLYSSENIKIGYKSIEGIKTLILEDFEEINRVRNLNSLFSNINNEVIKQRITETFPDIDINPGIALNNEYCNFIEFVPIYNAYIGIYEILNNQILELKEKIKDEFEKEFSGEKINVSTVINIGEQRDFQGKNIQELTDEAILFTQLLTKKVKRIKSILDSE